MNKNEIIGRYGIGEYERRLAQKQEYYKAHREEVKARVKKYQDAHPEEEKAATKRYCEEHPERINTNNREKCRKGGKHYAKHLRDNRTGLQGARNTIRCKHRNTWRQYKMIIAPNSQIHHEWILGTSRYRGIALVERDAHQHGIIDVIQILKGKITLFTEEEIRDQAREHGN
jgi:hypothetical protein